MRFLFLIILFPLLSFSPINNEEVEIMSPKDIIGVWLTHKQDVKVKIYEENGLYQGKAIWARDEELPDFDVFVLKNFKAKSSKLVGGTLIDPIKDDRYRCVIRKYSSNKLKLTVYSGIFFKNIYWTRVE